MGGVRHRQNGNGEIKITGKDERRGIKSAADTRRPAVLGALLDILPRCIDRKADNGEEMPGYYILGASHRRDWHRSV
jgi:hypothetical protein